MQWRGTDVLKQQDGKPLVFLATPAMDFRLDVQYVQSVISVLSMAGGTVQPYWLCGNSNIPEARNRIAHFFLAHTPCEVMVAVDSDIIFRLEDWEFLMEGEEDIVIAPYARKTLGREPVDFGMGFVRIHRRAFQKLADWMVDPLPDQTEPLVSTVSDDIAHATGLSNKEEALNRYLQDGELAVDYFFTGASKDMRWFGEDTGFFHWCNMNGLSYRKEDRCRLGHVGRFVYGYPDQIPGYRALDDAQ